MIAARWTKDSSVTFDYVLDEGVTAFVDREWTSGDASVPALLVYDNGEIVSWDGTAMRARRRPPETVADPQSIAAAALGTLARAAVAALPGGSHSRVEVTGIGVVASAIRSLLPKPTVSQARVHGRRPGEGRPLAVVDTTGSSAEIMAAARRIADAGTVVLAGPGDSSPTPVNIYSDVHRRGLRLVGIPPLPEIGRQAVVHMSPAAPAPSRRPAVAAEWYRLEDR
jgi:hypothetical protein